jgi:DNA-binding LytR/AlgR family response regulator
MKRLIIIDDCGHEKLVESFLGKLSNCVAFDSSKRGASIDMTTFLPGLPDENTSDKIHIEDENHVYRLRIEDVILLETTKDGCLLKLKGGDTITVKTSFQKIKSTLPERYFLKVNPRQVINLLHLSEISFIRHPEAVLSDGTRVPFSGDAAAVFAEYFENHSQ